MKPATSKIVSISNNQLLLNNSGRRNSPLQCNLQHVKTSTTSFCPALYHLVLGVVASSGGKKKLIINCQCLVLHKQQVLWNEQP